jgi:hypothetical protein
MGLAGSNALPSVGTDQDIFTTAPDNSDWRAAYQAALFEGNRTLMLIRIREAEALIVKRERQLFNDPDWKEQQSLVHALHSLRALRMCFGLE